MATTTRVRNIVMVESAKRTTTGSNEAQSRFILGSDLSNSSHSFEVESSPIKSRWSRLTSRNSPTKPQFCQIRNRSYMLSMSPQQQSPVTRSRSRRSSGVSTSRRFVNFGVHQESSNPLSNIQEETESTNDNSHQAALSSLSTRKRGRSHYRSPGKKATHAKKKKASDTYTVSIKPTVEVISVHNSDMAKWTPIREDAKSLLLESVTHSSSLMGVGRRKVFEKEKELMITKLRSELATAIAPKTGRLKSYSNLSSNKETLKSNFLALVKHNNHFDENLERFTSQAKDQLVKVKSIKEVLPPEKVLSTFLEEKDLANHCGKDWKSESEEAFCDYLIDLVQTSRCTGNCA